MNKDKDIVLVEAFEHPLRFEKVTCEVAWYPEISVKAILGPDLPYDKLEVWLDNKYYPQEMWGSTVGQGATVTIRAVPQRDVVRTALQFAIIIAAVYFAGPAGLGLTAGSAAYAAFVGGITLAGNLLLNALIPPAVPPSPKEQGEFNRLASLTGAQNRIGRFDPIPRLFGFRRYFPPIPMTALPFTEIVGDEQYIRALFILGYGPIDINGVTVDNTGVKTLVDFPALASAIRIGETTVDNFDFVQIEVGDPAQFTLFTQTVFEDRVDLSMDSDTQIAPGTVTDSLANIRTTQVGATEISIDVEFPSGLFSMADDGSDKPSEVSFTVEYRAAGSSDPWVLVDLDENLWYYSQWRGDYPTQLPPSATLWVIRGSSRQTVRRGLRWQVDPGQYEVRLTRLQTTNEGNNVGSTSAVWLTLKTITADNPFDVDNVVGLALRIKASDEISGTLDNFSIDATSILPVWNGTSWVNTITRSPAWAFVEALTGVGTRRPLNRDTEINLQDMIDWASACATQGFEFNFVSEGTTTLFEMIRMIVAAGRASQTIKNNQLTVIREEVEQTPRQIFSPRNSKNFRLQKIFPKVPHALRVQFIDPTTWDDSEVVVYADGFTEANATLFESLQIPGVTSSDQAWKLGRFHLAQVQLRPETYTFEADIDSLISQRGDAIAINNDAFLNGLASGRIKTVTDNGVNVVGFTTDEVLYMDPAETYSVAVRYIDSSGVPAVATSEITTVSPSTQSVTLTTPMPLEIQAGDLFTFGTTPVLDAKITRIEPNDTGGAEITAVPLASAILDADTGSIPPYDPVLNQPIDFGRLPPPTPEVLRVRSDETVLFRDSDGSLRAQLVVDFKFPPGQRGTKVIMRISEVDTHLSWRRYEVSSDAGKVSTIDIVTGVVYELQLRAVNELGLSSAWTSLVTHTVLGKSSPPSNVTGFAGTLEDFGIVLTWNEIPDLDRDTYEIRLGSTWATATFVDRTSATTLRTGIRTAGALQFLIKAIDTSGNFSTTESSTTVTVNAPAVTGLTSTFVGSNVELKWTGVPAAFQLREYEIRRGGSDWASAIPVTTIRTTAYRQEVDWAGNETWRVAAIDVAGNTGTAQSVTANVALPTIQSVNPQVIDNNVLLKWIPIQGTLPIDRYEVRKGTTFASAEVIGKADTTFAAFTESRGGTYTYWVLAIDSAGNEGVATSVTTTVNEPPDFVLQTNFFSDGLGARVNVQRISDDRRSILFNPGEEEYVSLPNTILDGLSDFTIEFGIAFDVVPDGHVVFATWDGVIGTDLANTFKLWFSLPDSQNRITVHLYPYGATAAAVSWTISGLNLYDGNFWYYSVRRDQSTGHVELLINGVSQGLQTVTGMSTMAVAAEWLLLGINVDATNGTRNSTPPRGLRIDEVRFWSGLRTATEVATYYDRELALNESGLVAYYRFNLQGNQITADDISPNDNNGNIFADQNLPIPELLVPFPSSETVQDKLDIHGYATPQAQITAGYDYVAQPVPLTASLEEIYNTGLVLPASRIQVLQTLADIVAGVTSVVTISTKKLIGDAWTSYGAGELDVYAIDFQYIRIHIDYTAATPAAFASLTQMATQGFVKRKTDEGTVLVSANPTTVAFNVDFLDVESIVGSGQGTTFVLPIIDFNDVPNPTGFDIYTFDAAGNPVTGRTVKWIARGV